MIGRTVYFFIFLILAFLINQFYPSTVFAQDQLGLDVTISPAILELTATPGSQITQRMRIWNNLSQPLPLVIATSKLSGADIHGHVVPVAESKGDTSLSWLRFNKNAFIAKPKDWTEIILTISVPKDAAFGYYYAITLSQSTKNIQNSTTKVLGSVAVPVLLEIKRPGAIKNGTLITFQPAYGINEYLPVDFTTVIANTGNVHIQPHGNIFIRDARDQDIGVLTVNDEEGNILPGSKREFLSSWTDGFIVNEPVIEDGTPVVDAKGNIKTHLVLNWNKLTSFRFGKYTAELVMVYDNGHRDVTLDGTTTFWVIPYTLITGILFVIIICAVIFKLLLSFYIKRQIQKYKNN